MFFTKLPPFAQLFKSSFVKNADFLKNIRVFKVYKDVF